MQNVQTFRAASMREALARVKRELGQDAVILGTRSCRNGGLSGLVGGTGIEITAAPPEAMPRTAPRVEPIPAAPRSQPGVPNSILPFYQELVQSEVAEELAQRIAGEAAQRSALLGRPTPDAIRSVLRETISKMIPVTAGIDLSQGQRRVALVGPSGAGKTTTLAKLAAHFKLREKVRVGVISLDMHRLGSNDQLAKYAEVIGVEMRSAQTIAGVKDALRELREMDLVLIDTHGVAYGDHGHFARLAAVLRGTRPHEVHLVLPASTLPAVQQRAAKRFGPLGVTSLVLTRLDEAAGLGVILNTIERLEWGLSYVTDGEKVPNNIDRACAERVASVLFPISN